MKSGIYQIRNLVNNKIYIGSTVDIKTRWRTHKNNLRRNLDRPNKYLQNSWNKHGENNFIFELIEEVGDREILLTREQHYLDKLC